MSRFALDDAGDIFVRDGGLVRFSGADEVVQKIRTKLAFYLGEWWLDEGDGVPWLQEILASPADVENAERIIKLVITSTRGVVELQTFESEFDSPTRAFTITFRVLTEFGPSGEEIIIA